MLLLTHVYFAKLVEGKIKPCNLAQYYLGATLPDIRYFSDIPRDSTHISFAQAKKLFTHDKDNSLLAGYLVHLLLDQETDNQPIYSSIRSSFPKFIHRLFTTKVINITIELFYLEKMKNYSKIQISGKFPEVLSKIGIKKEDFNNHVRSVNKILEDLSIKAIEIVVQREKSLKSNKKIQFYKRVGKLIEKPIIVRYLLKRIAQPLQQFEDNFVKAYTEAGI